MESDFSALAMAKTAKTTADESGFPSVAMANLAKLANFTGCEEAFSQISQNSHSHPPKTDFSAGQAANDAHPPLADPELGRLIAAIAAENHLHPIALWNWLDAPSIEALRSGDPAEAQAFRYAVGLPTWDSSPPPKPHGLPFPGQPPQHYPHHDRAPRPATGGPAVCCGNCGQFQPDTIGDGSGIGRCALMDNPPGGLLYPRIERRCPSFTPTTSTSNTEAAQ